MQEKRTIIGRRLRDGRLEKDVTKEILSDRLGLSVETINEIEAGKIDRRFVEVMSMAIALDIDLTELLSSEPKSLFDAVARLRGATSE